MGVTLHQLFHSFAVAKEVRSSTENGAHSINSRGGQCGWPASCLKICAT
jgi:hypothetical protein